MHYDAVFGFFPVSIVYGVIMLAEIYKLIVYKRFFVIFNNAIFIHYLGKVLKLEFVGEFLAEGDGVTIAVGKNHFVFIDRPVDV